jgi:hypothetical protein
MFTIFVAPKRRTERFADALRYEDVKFKRREQTEDRKRLLNMKWVVATDEHGHRRLQVRWTVARSSIPSTVCKPAPTSVQPAMGRRACDPTPGPEVRIAIS